MSTVERQLEAATILAEPVRRALYLYVSRQPHDVSRDEAAQATKVERPLAAFHLDKLVQAGLLDTAYRRLGGRTGPGAGRPSKLYRRTAKEIEVSVPQRQYALLARLLADAVAASRPARAALVRAARELGKAIGTEARSLAGPRPGRDQLLRSAETVLERMGFQPYQADRDTIRLRNCPFDAIAREHRDLVCGMNLELMDGVVGGLRVKGVTASLEPTAGMCCVALRRAPRS